MGACHERVPVTASRAPVPAEPAADEIALADERAFARRPCPLARCAHDMWSGVLTTVSACITNRRQASPDAGAPADVRLLSRGSARRSTGTAAALADHRAGATARGALSDVRHFP